LQFEIEVKWKVIVWLQLLWLAINTTFDNYVGLGNSCQRIVNVLEGDV